MARKTGARRGRAPPKAPDGTWSLPPAVVLAVEADGLLESLAPLPESTVVVHALYGDVGPGLIARALPDCILSPLIGSQFDAIELAHRVCGLGFRGRMVVGAPALPNRAAVKRELDAACDGLTVDLIELR